MRSLEVLGIKLTFSKSPCNYKRLRATETPNGNFYCNFIEKHVAPAAQRAIEKLKKEKGLLGNMKLTIKYRDSSCSEILGMNEAIKLYITKVTAFVTRLLDQAYYC